MNVIARLLNSYSLPDPRGPQRGSGTQSHRSFTRFLCDDIGTNDLLITLTGHAEQVDEGGHDEEQAHQQPQNDDQSEDAEERTRRRRFPARTEGAEHQAALRILDRERLQALRAPQMEDKLPWTAPYPRIFR